MPLLVNSVPNLAQGVSQQPDNLRYPGQCDEQINAWATVVEGLKKRPNTNYVKNIDSSSTSSNLFTHFVKRDEENQYVLTVSLGGVGVTDLADGTKMSVYVTSIANTYLGLSIAASLGGITNPLADLRALTVADYTFVVNKNKTVKADTSLKSDDIRNRDGKYEALVFVKLGDYEKTYDIYLDGKYVPHNTSVPNASNKTPPGGHTYESGTTSSGTHADTEIIAEDLEEQLNGFIGSGDDGVVSGVDFQIGTGAGFKASGRFQGVGLRQHGFEINQYPDDGTRSPDLTQDAIGTGAKGTMVFDKDGELQSYELTHKGSGYDGTLHADGEFDNPIHLVVKEYEKPAHWLKKWHRITTVTSTTPSYTLPTVNSVSIPTVASTNYEVVRENSVLKIIGETDFSIRVADGLANQGLGVAYKEVASITDLPARCFEGFSIKVRGDADIGQDDYYVRFKTKDSEEFGEGSWIETVGWQETDTDAELIEGIDLSLKRDTMPVTLVPQLNTVGRVTRFILQTPNELSSIVNNNGTIYSLAKDHDSSTANEPGTGTDWEEYWTVTTDFTQAPLWQLNKKYVDITLGYSPRQAGDNFTNPFPSFTDKKINDVFFFKNRLGFVTDNAVIFSEADEYFNFFRTTTQQLLDSAPIDVGLSHTKVAILQHAIPFQEKLMLFSKQSQFVLRGADVLSPKTVAISPVTEFDISDSVEPVALGNYIYFTFKRNDFEGMYEYYVDNNTEVFDAEEVTQQVPKYIPNNVRKIAGSQAENTLVVSTTDDLKTLYVYKYFWSNKEKIQSAWMKFTFDRDVVGFDFIDSQLYMITKDTEGLHLEFLTLEDGLKDEGLDYSLLLDSRLDGSELTVSYSASTKKSTISNFPYDPEDVEVYSKIGHKYNFTKTTLTAGEVSGDITSVPFFAGVPYNMLYRFSDQSLKQPTERGGRSASDYTYQTIRSGSINYADTGHFTVEVTPEYRDTYSYVFNPDIVGADLSLNEFEPQNGHFRFAVQAQPGEVKIEVKSDSALPCKLLAAEFESMFVPRSRRYGS